MATVECPHTDAPAYGRVCLHLLDKPDGGYNLRFSDTGTNYDLSCRSCREALPGSEADLLMVCRACFNNVENEGYPTGMIGQPRIRERRTQFNWTHEPVGLADAPHDAFLDIQPIQAVREPVFVALTPDGSLVALDVAARTATTLGIVPECGIDWTQPISLYVSPRGEFAAVVNTHGQYGAVLELATGKMTMRLVRDDDDPDSPELTNSDLSVAFFESAGRLLLIHATQWFRLDTSDPQTGELLTSRDLGGPHSLDYCHCQLVVSPSGAWVAEDGWIWHPMGMVAVWNLQQWLHDNVWESEDGSTRKVLCAREWLWNTPLCWLDDRALAVWGYGTSDRDVIPGVRIFDVVTSKQLRWFPGPDGQLAFDTYLFSYSSESGTAVWDVETGERLLHDPNFHPIRYHHGAKCFLSVLPDGSFQLSHLRDG